MTTLFFCSITLWSITVCDTGLAQSLAGSSGETNSAFQGVGSKDDRSGMFTNASSITPLTWRLNAQTQGAGTPNSAGVGIFWPAFKSDSGTLFVDALVNANFSDFSGYSSIINTDVAGVTPSTSTRVGYRWLNQDQSWMFGANAGYDTRSLKSGSDDTGVPITGKTTVRYQQVALGVEANSNSWNINTYALLPVGDKEQTLNSAYNSAALRTYGADVGYRMMAHLRTSLGYYYQSNNLDAVNGSGVKATLIYDWTNNFSLGANLSRDQVYQTRFSVSLQYSFGKPSLSSELPSGIFEPLRNRDIRVHDAKAIDGQGICHIIGQPGYSGC